MLTAAHVVEGAEGIRVRFQADRPEERVVEAMVAWADEGIDVAVLTLAGYSDDDVPAVVIGTVGEHDAVLTCTAMGFPRFKLRKNAAGRPFRDAEHMDARCAVLANRREGTLDLRITAPPAEDPDPERDAWEGMSGAAVFSGGYLVGVVSRHHRREGAGRVAAGRVDRWAGVLSAPELADLEELLGQSLTALPTAVPGSVVDLVREVYRAQLADKFAPETLEDRASELRDLVCFCGGTEPYLWLQGRPWAGKTALAAWFALHPPRGVVPVWFFITARNASQSGGDAFTAAVVDQLAAIAGREPTRHNSPAARDGESRLLLSEAAERVAQGGGTVLLVADGLDEDQYLLPGASGPSIASLLPERLPPNVRVLVTSRGNPGVPSDVTGRHPLRRCRVVKVFATEAVRHTEHEAKYELRQALSGDRLERDLVGLFTAARGALTRDDLRELTGEKRYVLDQRIESTFGRILDVHDAPGDGSDVTSYTTDRRFLFAHETLLAAAQRELGPDAEVYRKRLHAWAEKYQRCGWPEDTPRYLLQPYGHLVTLLGDVPGTVALATDPRRRDRLRAVTGGDTACLEEIAAARQAVHRATPDDLGALAALAAAADLVARRNVSLHPDIPAVYARLGQVGHAIELARSVFRPMDRSRALVGVARVLAEARDQRGKAVAEEAVRLVEEEVAKKPRRYGDSHALVAQGTLATALAAVGSEDTAMSLLRELPSPRFDGGIRQLIDAHVRTACVVQGRVCADELLHRAEKRAELIEFAPDRIRVLADLAEAWTTVGARADATRLYDSVFRLAHREEGTSENLAAVAAEVLRRVRPHEAQFLTRLAEENWDRQLRHSRGIGIGEDWETTYGEVYGLIITNRMEDAQRLVDIRRDSPFLGMRKGEGTEIWLALADGWARKGRVAEAWAALEGFWETRKFHDDDDRSAARVARLLAEAGSAEQLESHMMERTSSRWAVAEVHAALAVHFAADDPDRSSHLLRRAEYGLPENEGTVSSALCERLAAFAEALAIAGRSDDAERLVDVIGEPRARACAYAAISVADASRDAGRALRLAERAIEASIPADGSYVGLDVKTAVIRALACAGAVDRTVEALARLSTEQYFGESDGNRARAEAAAVLWPHAPDVAGRWVDDLFPKMREEYARGLAPLVAAAWHDGEHRARVMRLLHGQVAEPGRYQQNDDDVLLSLVTATRDCATARRSLDQVVSWQTDMSHFEAGGMGAVAYAALGDYETAGAMVRRSTDEEWRSEVFAQLAAYAVGVADNSTLTPLDGFREDVRMIRSMATLILPPSPGPDVARARALLAQALTPDGWHHAVPVLAAIDPEAVLRVRDVVFAHLGLSD